MINWKLAMHMNGKTEHSLLYRAEYKGIGIQAEIHTPKYKSGKFGKQKTYYYIDNDKREFKTEEELIKALEDLK